MIIKKPEVLVQIPTRLFVVPPGCLDAHTFHHTHCNCFLNHELIG